MTTRYTPKLWRRQAALEKEATKLIKAADRRRGRERVSAKARDFAGGSLRRALPRATT